MYIYIFVFKYVCIYVNNLLNSTYLPVFVSKTNQQFYFYCALFFFFFYCFNVTYVYVPYSMCFTLFS